MDKNDKFKDIMEEFESFSPTEKDIEKKSIIWLMPIRTNQKKIYFF